jgi:hypothetical protein
MGVTMAVYEKTTKIRDGPASLGPGRILPGTIFVDGKAPPAEMSFDMERGTVQWTDQEKLGDPGPYVITFEYDDSAIVSSYEEEIAKHIGKQFSSLTAAEKYHLLALRLGVIDAEGIIKPDLGGTE